MIASKEAQNGGQQTGVVVEQDGQQGDEHAALQLSCFGLPQQQPPPGCLGEQPGLRLLGR